MGEIITIDPITRISGFLEIRAEVEQNTIINAETDGLLFRGFETMLKGREPLDAVYFTERICGICSAAHALASTVALEMALNVGSTINDRFVRQIIHGFEFIQNHLRQFYLFTFPSYVKFSEVNLIYQQQYQDFRLPDDINRRLEEHYIQSIEYSRLAHEGQAVFGGKAPHNHGIFVGGATANIDSYKIEKIKSIANKILLFVSTAMREDADILAQYYSDYFEKGISYPNFMTFGVFDNTDKDISYLGPGIMVEGVRYPLDTSKITEEVTHSWFDMKQTEEEVNLLKPGAYTFIKAPRYQGLPMEVGPLARLLISGEYTGGHSCMDRNIARMLETEKVLNIILNLTDRLEVMHHGMRSCIIPPSAQGSGLIDTTRGALGHWINIEEKLIHDYNIITPSVWNLSPKDSAGKPGVAEKALIGSTINDMNNPVEIGRILRSFDPCVSCATHLIGENGSKNVIEVPV